LNEDWQNHGLFRDKDDWLAQKKQATDDKRAVGQNTVKQTTDDKRAVGQKTVLWDEKLSSKCKGHVDKKVVKKTKEACMLECDKNEKCRGAEFTRMTGSIYASGVCKLCSSVQSVYASASNYTVFIKPIKVEYPVQIALIYSIPFHPAWEHIIRHVVSNINKRFYPKSVLAITGPIAVYEGMKKYRGPLQPRRDLQLFPKSGTMLNMHYDFMFKNMEDVKEDKILVFSNDKFHKQTRKDSFIPHYSELFHNHQVYCDEPSRYKIPC